ncbi:MAG: riboflavin synthase [Bdellovibrionia bacterium]
MFSGIIESVQPILKSTELTNAFRIEVRRPDFFDDLKTGDSIACDGVCLTLEEFSEKQLTFTLAAETIRVLNWKPESWLGKKLNLERSLRFGDRIHGHLVTGHVDSLGTVVSAENAGDSFFLKVAVAPSVLPFVWVKGSITINGVSLTVNKVEGDTVEVCLIPETVKRTNLGDLTAGQVVNIEPDYMAKAVARAMEYQKLSFSKDT